MNLREFDLSSLHKNQVRTQAVSICLLLLMLSHVRAYAAVIFGLIFIIALVAIVMRRRLLYGHTALAVLCATIVLSFITFWIWDDWSLDRIDHAWMLIAFGLACTQLALPPNLATPRTAVFVLVLSAAFLFAYVILGMFAPETFSGAEPGRLTLFGHDFVKESFLAVAVAWSAVAILVLTTGRKDALALLTLPAIWVLISPAQAASVALFCGVVGALAAVNRPMALLVALGIFALPLAATLGVPTLAEAANLQVPFNWAERLELWSEGLRLALERPLTGWGFQSFSELKYSLMELERPNHAHSAPIDLLLDFGLWGLLCFAALAWQAAGALRPERLDSMSRILVLTPLLTWLVVISISLDLWNDYVFAGTATVWGLAFIAARVAAAERPATQSPP